MVKGEVSTAGPVLVRVHAVNVVTDVLHPIDSNSSEDLHGAMKVIGDEGRGVVVLIRDTRSTTVSTLVGKIAQETVTQGSLRDLGIGAQILLDLGVSEMILLSNAERAYVGLDGFGLRVTERRSIGKPDV